MNVCEHANPVILYAFCGTALSHSSLDKCIVMSCEESSICFVIPYIYSLDIVLLSSYFYHHFFKLIQQV